MSNPPQPTSTTNEYTNLKGLVVFWNCPKLQHHAFFLQEGLSLVPGLGLCRQSPPLYLDLESETAVINSCFVAFWESKLESLQSIVAPTQKSSRQVIIALTFVSFILQVTAE
jgi:hypothetical protein